MGPGEVKGTFYYTKNFLGVWGVMLSILAEVASKVHF
jgi:hypothetical protein